MNFGVRNFIMKSNQKIETLMFDYYYLMDSME
jgi:hypothetical protein